MSWTNMIIGKRSGVELFCSVLCTLSEELPCHLECFVDWKVCPTCTTMIMCTTECWLDPWMKGNYFNIQSCDQMTRWKSVVYSSARNSFLFSHLIKPAKYLWQVIRNGKFWISLPTNIDPLIKCRMFWDMIYHSTSKLSRHEFLLQVKMEISCKYSNAWLQISDTCQDKITV